jgi:hypothetical protein
MAVVRTALCLLVLTTVAVNADVFLHNPRGSNNRFRGDNNNQARLFDYQVRWRLGFSDCLFWPNRNSRIAMECISNATSRIFHLSMAHYLYLAKSQPLTIGLASGRLFLDLVNTSDPEDKVWPHPY